MAGQIRVPFWPAAVDCLDWSKDNLLAVGGGEAIALLVPSSKDCGTKGTLWESIIIRVNAFTAEEVPLADPLSFKNFSIGEEQSNRLVQALAWSSPGLGKYGRCVLAVLSSNHTLSIWECTGKIEVVSDWERVAVVNHAIWKGRAPRRTGETDEEFDERLQASQRVRAFAWSPPMHGKRPSHDQAAFSADYGDQSLAVATGADEIVVLRIRSPHDILDPASRDWTLEVTDCFGPATPSVEQLRTRIHGGDEVDEVDEDARATADASRVADYIAWSSPRIHETYSMSSTIAYISQGRLFCAVVESSKDDNTKTTLATAERPRFLPKHKDLAGPMRFVPQTQSLIVFGADAVFCVDTARDPKDPGSFTSHHLDGRWDEVTGVAFSATDSGAPHFHFTSMLSSSSTATTNLPIPFDGSVASAPPAWQTALINTKTAFGNEHKLGENVLERVWGISSSPLGDLVATATSLLPSNAVAYVTGGDQYSTINITHHQQHGNLGSSYLFGMPSTALLCGLKAYLARQSTAIDRNTLVEAMLKAFAAPAHDTELNLGIFHDPMHCVRHLRHSLLLSPEMVRARFQLLADFALTDLHQASPIARSPIQHLVPEVLKLPLSFAQAGELSRTIYNMYTTVQSRLHPNAEPSSTADRMEAWREDCRICQESMTFQSVKWARCENGHQFTRCALTFLAMQGPGISKKCSICGTQYLSEWALPALARSRTNEDVDMMEIQDEQSLLGRQGVSQNIQGMSNRQGSASANQEWVQVSQSPAEPSGSLARILFAAFDKCIYCGGSF